MTAKHSSVQEPTAPPCFVPTDEIAKAVQHERKMLGQLNGPWVKAFKITQTVVIPVVVAVGGYVGNEVRLLSNKIGELERNYAVIQQVITQIKTNTEIIQRHEKAIAENSVAIVALAKELGTADQRYLAFVTRREWEMKNETRDREISGDRNDNRSAHDMLMAKLDRQSDKLDRLIERVK